MESSKNYKSSSAGKNLLKSMFLFMLLIAFNLSCSKDDINNPENLETGEIKKSAGATPDDFDAYPGDVGFVIDAREIAKKGYMPSVAEVTIEATEGNYSQNVAIDPITLMGQIKISKKGLSVDAINELKSGVSVSSVIKDEHGNSILTDPKSKISFLSNPNARTINATTLVETEEHNSIKLSDSTTYYIQRMDADGNPENSAWRYLEAEGYSEVITSNDTQFNGNEPDRGFTFIAIPGELNTFAIRHAASKRYVQATQITTNVNTNYYGTFVAPNLSNRTSFSKIQSASDYDNFKFRFDKTEDGSYSIVNIAWGDSFPIQQINGYGLSISKHVINPFTNIQTNAQPRTWRIISTTIDWNVQNIGTNFLEPILGPAQTAFGFNNTLINCGNGGLSQTVGGEVSEDYSETVGWEESLSFTSTSSTSISATIGVEFEAGFFGTSATYSASITANHSHEQSSTQSSSQWLTKTKDEKKSFFSERTVTVPSGSATLVYDAYQFYDNTLVNFVQRLRISGTDSKTGKPLSGEEIQSQFHFSGFNGVIAAVEPTSVVITLRGTTLLSKIFKTESNAQDVPANCN